MKKIKKIVAGSVVAFNHLPEAVWFDVMLVDGFTLTVREHGTNYVHQLIDRSLVVQVKDK